METVSQSDGEVNQTTQNTNQTAKILDVTSELQLFKTPGGDFYARVPVNGHFEVWPLRGRTLKDWIIFQYYAKHRNAPNPNALNSVIQLLESHARFSQDTREVYIRVASHDDTIYLDLCNDVWEVVKINEHGWEVVKESPVMFRRSNGMLPLPKPVQGGKIDELRERGVIRTSSENDWILLVAWLLGTLYPKGSYTQLALQGEQGTAKTSTITVLRSLIDPNIAPTHKQPRESKDLHIKAHNTWIVALDNISSMPRWLSDALCGLSTGSGEGTRKLYSDDEQVVFSAKRPCSINGIEELTANGDLADRAVIVSLDVIPESERRTEEELKGVLNEIRPGVLGALLTAASTALRNLPTTQLTQLPRMADFTKWVTAAEPALGWRRGTFVSVYLKNRAAATSLTIEASPVAQAICKMIQDKNEWKGTATELDKALRAYVPDTVLRLQWPNGPTKLSGELKRVAPALRTQGLSVDFIKGKTRTIELKNTDSDATETLPTQRDASPPLQRHHLKPIEGGGPWAEERGDARDAKMPLYTTPFPWTQEKREEVGAAKVASLASVMSQPAYEGGSDGDARDGDSVSDIFVASEEFS